MTADATIDTTPAAGSKRERTRAQGIRRFKWAVLTPFLALMLFILMPALLLQGYFSFFAFSIFDAGENTGFSSYLASLRASDQRSRPTHSDASK